MKKGVVEMRRALRMRAPSNPLMQIKNVLRLSNVKKGFKKCTENGDSLAIRSSLAA